MAAGLLLLLRWTEAGEAAEAKAEILRQGSTPRAQASPLQLPWSSWKPPKRGHGAASAMARTLQVQVLNFHNNLGGPGPFSLPTPVLIFSCPHKPPGA